MWFKVFAWTYKENFKLTRWSIATSIKAYKSFNNANLTWRKKNLFYMVFFLFV